ncbi:MAG: tripartite tricarboxylate transporter substrate binding protein [Betaproteobacteria bacterium]|nr:tripartite tricarboxylate transporter substrate binding protein [Betaproteobacteria bacterium]
MLALLGAVRPFLAILALLAVLAPAQAQEAFPGNRPIELVVLFPAGSSADVTARVLAEGMGKRLGTQIVVVNRPGGGGAVGYRYAVNQAPDGHHLVWNSNSISTTYHTGMLPFDYKSFTPVARVQIETPLLFVRSDSPWKSLRDILQYAKANPGKLTVGNSGFGSHTHLSAVWLFRAAGASITDVPFNAAQVVPSLLGGHVDSVVQLPGALAGHVQVGTVRALVALSGARDASFPGVPTAQEAGLSAVAELWRGIVVPRGTPQPIVARLEKVIRETVMDPHFSRAAEKLLATPAFLPRAEFGRLIAREDVEIAKAVATMGLKKSAK